MNKYFILFFLTLAARGEIVDKIIIEDWDHVKTEELNGQFILRPTLMYVFIDELGKQVVVTKGEWEKKRI